MYDLESFVSNEERLMCVIRLNLSILSDDSMSTRKLSRHFIIVPYQ